MEQINFVKLRMDKPVEELLGPNDVLGIYIAGITGSPEEAPPIHNIGTNSTDRPASGYPYMVRSDGTLSLPMLPEPIYVEGMTLIKAEEAIRAAYTLKREIVRTDANISVSLIKPRTYHVTVIREDVTSDDMRTSMSSNVMNKGAGYMAGIARGTATSLELPAYRNDVLEALSQTGGLPGLMQRMRLSFFVRRTVRSSATEITCREKTSDTRRVRLLKGIMSLERFLT